MTASSALAEPRQHQAARTLRLLDAPSLGPHRLYKLLETHGSLDQVERYLGAGPKVPERVREHIKHTALDRYLNLMHEVHARGDDFKLWSDPDYPANLGLWRARPAVLFYRGDLSHLGQRALALVGRVDPSPDGERSAHRFARMCVENDITVVSGLAKGIDGTSHRAALMEPPGRTYAVVGHGLDFAYPSENQDLYEAIPHRGAILSQFPLGVSPQRWTFPARNETMCTLALGTVIVEGKPGCGSIIQADFSFKHDRPVFVLSRNLRVGDTAWAKDLVSKGAHVVEHFDQVLQIVREKMGELWSDRPTSNVVQDELFTLSDHAVQPVEADRPLPAEEVVPRMEPGVSGELYALLFDVDGVVADSRATTAAALAKIVRRHTGREINPETMITSGAPHKILQANGVGSAYEVYRAEYDLAFAEASATHMRTFGPAVDALAELKRAGVRVGAITAQPRRRAERLLPPEVRSQFDLYYTYNETNGKKEVGITRALHELGVDQRHAAYVGDTPPDLAAARKAGVRSVAVAWGFTDAATLAGEPHDLLLHVPSELGESILHRLFH